MSASNFDILVLVLFFMGTFLKLILTPSSKKASRFFYFRFYIYSI